MKESLKNYLMKSDTQTVINAYMTGNIDADNALEILIHRVPRVAAEQVLKLATANRNKGWTDIMVSYPKNINYRVMDRNNLIAIGTLDTVLEGLVKALKVKSTYRSEPGYIKKVIDFINKSNRFRLERVS